MDLLSRPGRIRIPPHRLTPCRAEPLRRTRPLGQQLPALFAAPVIGTVVAGHEHLHASKRHAQVLRDGLVGDSFRPHFQNGRLLRSCHHRKTPPLAW